MVVRMLGYGSTAMNNNYPYSFIDKAISLGLDAELGEDYVNEANATRGQTMQILYNALTVAKSDGSTLGYDYFNVEKATVVITGNKSANLYTKNYSVTKLVEDVEFVSFSVLNDDFTVAADSNYYALKTEFGIAADADANLYIGKSYNVLSNDGFQTFILCDPCKYEVVDQTAITGGASATSGQKNVTIDGVKYTIKDAKTSFVNGGTKTTNDTEIILSVLGEHSVAFAAESYVMDSKLNILKEDGSILLYWFPTYGIEGTVINGGIYLYMIPGTEANPQYVEPNAYIWSLAKKTALGVETGMGYTPMQNTYLDLEQWDAYSDTVLYDDNDDGIWDRGIYFQYTFAKLGKNSSGFLTADGEVVDSKVGLTNTNMAATAVKYYNADTEKISFDDVNGKYVLYNYNKVTDTMIVKEIFAGQNGLVTAIDAANGVVTFNGLGVNPFGTNGYVAGTSIAIGNAKLMGATKAHVIGSYGSNVNAMIGKNVNFIVKDDKVLEIYDYANNGDYMIYVHDNAGFTTMGYKNILAYYNPATGKAASTMAVVSVNAVSNFWYGASINMNGFVAPGMTNIDELETGALLAASKDAFGNYDVAEVPATHSGYRANVAKVEIKNGFVSFYKADGTAVGAPFKADANTVFLAYAGDGNDFDAFTGVPTSGASITVNGTVFVNGDDLVYVNGGAFDTAMTNGIINPWGDSRQATTVIYVTNETISTANSTNQYPYGAGVTIGNTWTYSKAVDLVNGGYANNIMTDYNFGAYLTAGKFYAVENGYVVREIAPADLYLYDIYTMKLIYADNDDSWKVTYTKSANDTVNEPALGAIDTINTIASVLPEVYLVKQDGNYQYGFSISGAMANVLTYYDNSTYKAGLADYAEKYTTVVNPDMDYAVVYYHVDTLDRANPIFTQIGLSAEGTLAAYVPTEGTCAGHPQTMDIDFELWGTAYTAAAAANAQIAIWTVDANGNLDEKVADFEQVGNAYVAKADDVALYKNVHKTVDGVCTGTATKVATDKTYAIVVSRDVLNSWNIEAFYCKQGIQDTFVKSEWTPLAVYGGNTDVNGLASDIFTFTVNSNMQTLANTGNIYVGFYFTAK